MRSAILTLTVLAGLGCGRQDIERLRLNDLDGAATAFHSNIAAIQRRDVEGYLAHYLNSPELVIAGADSLRRGFLLFAEARRADDTWPDTLIAGELQLFWIGPGVVWGAFEFTSVMGSDTTSGWSERLFMKTGGGWKIAVTGTMER